MRRRMGHGIVRFPGDSRCRRRSAGANVAGDGRLVLRPCSRPCILGRVRRHAPSRTDRAAALAGSAPGGTNARCKDKLAARRQSSPTLRRFGGFPAVSRELEAEAAAGRRCGLVCLASRSRDTEREISKSPQSWGRAPARHCLILRRAAGRPGGTCGPGGRARADTPGSWPKKRQGSCCVRCAGTACASGTASDDPLRAPSSNLPRHHRRSGLAPRPPRDGAPWPRCCSRQRRCGQHPLVCAGADDGHVRGTMIDPALRRMNGCLAERGRVRVIGSETVGPVAARTTFNGSTTRGGTT